MSCGIWARFRRKAHKRPTPIPKVAVEKPRKVKLRIELSIRIKTIATIRPPKRPTQSGTSGAPRTTAKPASKQRMI
jgi:hypothetical protein